jgi:hypothetical protein
LETLVLDGDWDFGYLPELLPDGTPPPIGRVTFPATMPVPAYWDDHPGVFESPAISPSVVRNPKASRIDYKKEVSHEGYFGLKSELPYVLGVGYYRRTIALPEHWRNGTVVLEVGGVSQQAWVHVNGRPAGHHFGHSTPFEFEIGNFLKPGADNEIVLVVTNLGPDRGGFALQGFKGRTAGIYRSVRLHRSSPVRIADCYVHPDPGLEKLNWQVELSGAASEAGCSLEWAVVDPGSGTTLGSGREDIGGLKLRWKTGSLAMRPWSDHDPKLYSLELRLVRGETLLDRLVQPFGLRRLVRTGPDLLLNGSRVFLRGVTDFCYFSPTCNPPRDIGAYLEIIRRLQRVGFNWIRFHTWIPSEEYMFAADQLGMLMMVEAPRGFEKQEWIDILKVCRRHPSVVLYSGGNEECLDEVRIEFLARMADLVHTRVPDALFNPQEALRGVEYCWDEEDFGGNTVAEPFKHNPTRLARLKEFSDVFGQYSWTYLSYDLVKADRHHLDKCHAIYKAPLLAHEISIRGSYIDFDLEHRMVGTRIGTGMYESAREVLQAQGLYENAPIYYRNSCAWLRIFRKHVIEMTRKCKWNRGYDLLSAHDHHCIQQGFHSGLMNDFFELKPGESAADLVRYNGESVLLLDTNNERNLRPGEAFSLPLLLSYYGRPDLAGAKISWHLKDDDGRIAIRGGWPIGRVASGTLTEIGTLSFTVPEFTTASRLKLVIRLDSKHCELVNDWDYWVFPGSSAVTPPRGVRIVSDLDAATLDDLENGGRVILFGTGGLPHRAVEHQIILAGRVRGNLATVINDHPILRGFPHDGWASWQFDNLFNNSAAIVFNDLEVPFDPIIEVVSTYKLVRKQANLFEARVGKGRLLVCTMNMTGDDPGTAFLKDAILRYAADDFRFRPTVKMDAAILRHYMDNPSEDVAVLAERAVNANREGNVDE